MSTKPPDDTRSEAAPEGEPDARRPVEAPAGPPSPTSSDEEHPTMATAQHHTTTPATRPGRLVPVVVPSDDADHALVVASRAGDAAAFARLFDRHHGRVSAMCRRLLADRAEVDDAVQQTFLEAWRSLPRFEGRSRFSTWITRIAIHTCLGFRRRLKRLLLSADIFGERDGVAGPRPVNDAWAEGAAQTDAGPQGTAPPSPFEGAAHRARRVAVDEILQRLSPKKRVVFVLAELEGMTAPEIAEIVAIPEATVRTRLFHARKEFAAAATKHAGFADLFDARGDGAAHDGETGRAR